MADWNRPVIDDLKIDVLDLLKARDFDSVTLAETPTNPPVGYVRWNTTAKTLQKWNGTGWDNLVISLAGGGTGSTGTSGNFGTMAYQNSNNVAISGGTIQGLSTFSVAGGAHIVGLLYSGPSIIQVTQGDGYIREEAIADGDIYCRRGANESIDGSWTFQTGLNSNGWIWCRGTNPAVFFEVSGTPADQKRWGIFLGTDNLHFNIWSDDWSTSASIFGLYRSGASGYKTVTYVPAHFNHVAYFMNRIDCFGSLNVAGNSLISSLQNNLQFVAGYASPVGGKIIWGDGGGWQLQFCTNWDISKPRMIFYDNGSIQTIGPVLQVAQGNNNLGSKISVSENSNSNAPAIMMSGDPGVHANYVVFANNYLGTAANNMAIRANTSFGGTAIQLGHNSCTFAGFPASGQKMTLMNILGAFNTIDVHVDQMRWWNQAGNASAGQITAEYGGVGDRLTINGGRWMTVGVQGAAQGMTFKDTQFIQVYATNLCCNTDGGLYIGYPTFKWHSVWSMNGTIQTSDLRAKNSYGKIERARELIKSIDPGIYSFDERTLETGEVVPEFKFPGFTAQEIDSKIDSKLGTGIVRKENPDSWGMNYSHLIPVMWAALKELLEDYDSRQN